MKKQHRQGVQPTNPESGYESGYELMLRLQPVTGEVADVKQPKWQPSFNCSPAEENSLSHSATKRRILH